MRIFSSEMKIEINDACMMENCTFKHVIWKIKSYLYADSCFLIRISSIWKRLICPTTILCHNVSFRNSLKTNNSCRQFRATPSEFGRRVLFPKVATWRRSRNICSLIGVLIITSLKNIAKNTMIIWSTRNNSLDF